MTPRTTLRARYSRTIPRCKTPGTGIKHELEREELSTRTQDRPSGAAFIDNHAVRAIQRCNRQLLGARGKLPGVTIVRGPCATQVKGVEAMVLLYASVILEVVDKQLTF